MKLILLVELILSSYLFTDAKHSFVIVPDFPEVPREYLQTYINSYFVGQYRKYRDSDRLNELWRLNDKAYLTSEGQLDEKISLPLTAFDGPTIKMMVRKLNAEKNYSYSSLMKQLGVERGLAAFGNLYSYSYKEAVERALENSDYYIRP